jgi:hypothetical protein
MLGQLSSDQVIDLQRLVNILLQLDFESLNQKEPISKILQRVFPQLSPTELTKVEKKAEILLQAMNEDKSNNQLFKLTFTLAATVAGLYIGGPYVVKGSKVITTQIYTLLFGTPDPNSFLYGILFKPCLSAVSKLAVAYGPSIAGLTSATATFGTITLAELVTNRIRSLKQWAFDKNLLSLSPVPIALKHVDEILAEFELLTVKADPLPIVVQYDKEFAILPAYLAPPSEDSPYPNTGDKTNPSLKFN